MAEKKINDGNCMAVYAVRDKDKEEALKLAGHLGVEMITAGNVQKNDGLMLVFNEDGLSLSDGTLFMRGDFTSMLPRIRSGRLQGEILIHAAKKKDKNGIYNAVDATAGMGEDAFLLAAAGFNVTLYESDPVIAALLRDSLKRALIDPNLKDVAERMKLFEEDSVKALPKLLSVPELVLLDPMFPARHKSGLIKKKFQLLQKLEKPCSDGNDLFNAAVLSGAGKIIVKRPLKGPYLTDRKPGYSLKGNCIRYDCYINKT